MLIEWLKQFDGKIMGEIRYCSKSFSNTLAKNHYQCKNDRFCQSVTLNPT
jgi:hypothetical protein